jgi:hypothetical protein
MMKNGLIASSALAMAILSAGSAMAIDQNDAANCGPQVLDPNGGCNVTPSQFQAIGSYGVGDFVSINGTIGTFDPAGGANFTSRDLDWYTFTLTEDSKVTIQLDRLDGGTVVLFLGNGNTCPADIFFGQEIASFTPQEFYLTAGSYTVVATTPFEPVAAGPYIHACSDYSLAIDIQAGDSSCGTGATNLPCDVVHGPNQPGCDDWNCCNLVCLADPSCCGDTWDALCVSNGAVAICGYFIYNCNDTSPANDCLTSAQVLTLGTDVAFTNVNANTDGPSTLITGAASGTVSDVWFTVQANVTGQLNVIVDHPTVDTVLELYGPFDNASIANPEEEIPPAYIGTVDAFGAGGEGLTLLDAEGGKFYLIRVGSWVDAPATGAGTISTSLDQVVYTTGIQQFVITGGQNQNLGLSSGALSAAQPRRWLARPFIAPAIPGGGTWDLTQIIAKGFVPAGVVNQTLNWVIWEADAAFAIAPVNGDQVASGSVAFPVPFDDALDDAANASHPIVLDPPVSLNPGNYYLSVFGASAGDFANGGTTASNFAWFIYSPGGIIQTTGAGAAFSWRSNDALGAGFLVYQALGAFAVQAGDDPKALYSNAFTILGSPVAAPPVDTDGDGVPDETDNCPTVSNPDQADSNGNGIGDACDAPDTDGDGVPDETDNCPTVSNPDQADSNGNGIGDACDVQPCIGDFNNSGAIDASDLAILLGAWGGTGGDLNGSGTTDASDLAILLGGWGNCP